jgi:hypothetical protein
MTPRALLPAGSLALLLALAVTLPFLTTARTRRDYFFFEVTLTSTQAGATQCYFDVGRGFNESDSSVQPLKAERRPVVYRYMLPPGEYHGLRLDPIDREGMLTLKRARIVDSRGHVCREFPPENFHAVQQISSLVPLADALRLTVAPGANDPYLTIDLGAPLRLTPDVLQLARMAAPVFAGVFAAVLALALLPVPRPLAAAGGAAWQWLQARPKTAVALTALLAVSIQCHPVIFLGRSFVTPNNGAYMLYGEFPTLPGYASPTLENGKGSDVGAMLFHHVYLPKLQRDALFRDHELPLWNRYNVTGIPLLGQGQSMFGDPLNWIPLLAGSDARAWDFKFILARWGFAVGIGLTVLLLLGRLPIALLLALVAVFLGFFGFRLNHAANFSVDYAPWILFAWVLVAQAGTARRLALALLLLVAANGCVMTSGTIKEAYMLMFCLNFTGLLLVLLADEAWPQKMRRVGAAAVAGLGFVLLTAPVWLTFLSALKKSYTSYDQPSVQQLPLWMLPGLFDDLFYRQSRPEEMHAAPSLNFVILFGVAWSLAAFATLRRSRGWVALGLGLLPPFALVYGLVPGSLILKVPFLANVQHVENTFSCSLLVLGLVFGAYGLQACRDSLRQRRGWIEYAGFVLLLAGWGGYYLVSIRPWGLSDFFRGYAGSLALGLLGVPLLLRWGSRQVAAIALAGGLLLGCWRHAQYLRSPFDDYVFNPQVRVNLQAASPAVQYLDAANAGEPDRPSGFGYNLFPGYNQMISWESIYGVDPVRNRSYEEFARAAGLGRIAASEKFVTPEETVPLRPFLDLLNVRHYLALPVSVPPVYPGLMLLCQLDLAVYASPTAWPRAFFTDRVSLHRSLPEFLAQVRAGDGRPFASVDAADRGSEALGGVSRELAHRTIHPATGYRLTTNTTSFEIVATGPGVVVLTEAFYPGDFVALVDGRPVPYFRVNHAFKGVFVSQPGRHQISFRYWPEHFSLSLWLGAAGLVLLAGLGVAVSRSRDLPPPAPRTPAAAS